MKRIICLFGVLFSFLANVPVYALSMGVLTVTVTNVEGSSPRGAQRVPLLTLTLSNACDGLRAVVEMTIRHRGLGDPADFDRIYLMEDNRRLSDSVRFSADNTARIRPRGFSVPNCKERTITVAGDFAADATPGGEHLFELAAVDTGSREFVLILPSSNASRTISKAGEANATVHVELLPLMRNLTYGANRVVSRLQLRGDRRVDQLIRVITFTNDGSARGGDLRNLRLERSNGQQISGKLATMDSDRVTFTLNPMLPLRSNETILVYLKADVRASSRRTVRFIIEEPSDIEATQDRRR